MAWRRMEEWKHCSIIVGFRSSWSQLYFPAALRQVKSHRYPLYEHGMPSEFQNLYIWLRGERKILHCQESNFSIRGPCRIDGKKAAGSFQNFLTSLYCDVTGWTSRARSGRKFKRTDIFHKLQHYIPESPPSQYLCIITLLRNHKALTALGTVTVRGFRL
jgi:hypothetical protein